MVAAIKTRVIFMKPPTKASTTSFAKSGEVTKSNSKVVSNIL
ncbi:hypothetical protein M23134_06865 [Microscilla marina ATCC 23134]|uniref:Uncharacterized protein n=1 Tax=Microscilla marina ATCC 23134 TaxID=313606 RepID=A1ZQ55_MICM2|nr:hypothetical protein M23134_06865 [Microscilla marina ATCC 23134]